MTRATIAAASKITVGGGEADARAGEDGVGACADQTERGLPPPSVCGVVLAPDAGRERVGDPGHRCDHDQDPEGGAIDLHRRGKYDRG